MVCEEDTVIEKVCELYDQISRLDSLKPCKNVDMLLTQLVLTCMSPVPIDVTKLTTSLQRLRSNLIRICGEAESLLETHYSTILASFHDPLNHLHLFPYYSNYINLALLDFTLLSQHHPHGPTSIAFVGSGPLPLTSILLASNHLPTTTLHNYDLDPVANSMALKLVSSDPDLSNRMVFHSNDILDVTEELEQYEVVYLAALVGLSKKEKIRVIEHLKKYMTPGAILMLRSAHGARAFLYPVVDTSDLGGFEVLSVFHPTNDVVNSVVVARKCAEHLIDQEQELEVDEEQLL